jgi:hypothetical protein
VSRKKSSKNPYTRQGNAPGSLAESVVVDLVTGKTRRDDYRGRANPPVLHRKETFLPPDHPLHPKFAKLTRAEEAAGLLADIFDLACVASSSGPSFRREQEQPLDPLRKPIPIHPRRQVAPAQADRQLSRDQTARCGLTNSARARHPAALSQPPHRRFPQGT